ncbi:hypothetical protein POVWA2_025040 [Plasmodium ovale wallikeri]|uniref:Uncharacterized protein n=1 Tax=Plasmodium ovale wallikeri TaxID=864142 RepID=A0A1A8YU23_PLAOA|nr:hypothetical protein POVWA1_025220 [Plasmodium ovale wallikeri]SBT35438.1 hypothetical protein POVWA2_025040 [Plasmodium ovale wallikeri]
MSSTWGIVYSKYCLKKYFQFVYTVYAYKVGPKYFGEIVHRAEDRVGHFYRRHLSAASISSIYRQLLSAASISSFYQQHLSAAPISSTYQQHQSACAGRPLQSGHANLE